MSEPMRPVVTLGRQRWLRTANALARRLDRAQPLDAWLCPACAETLSVSGAGITIMAGPGARAALCASNATVVRLADLEFTLGHGPGTEAHEQGVPVIEIDLASRPPIRWAGYAVAAIEAGTHAVFAFPLQLGAVRLGSLTLYQDGAGPLSDDTHAQALLVAEVVTRAILARQSGLPEDALLAELSDGRGHQAEVHQAAGMISVQLGVGVGDAMARLQARSFAQDRPIGQVAADVVSRRLRFDA